jgi:uncharacterized protein YxjI
MHPAFYFNQYTLKRQVLALTGKFRIYDPTGNLLMYSQQKMFKLREDIRVYSDETMRQELLYIQARNIIDFSAAYDVCDQTTGMIAGTIRRRGWRSLACDEWEIMDPAGRITGVLIEDSLALGLIRRFLAGSLLPQNYDILMKENRVADLRQRFHLFRYELDVDFSLDSAGQLDRRLGLAAAILLAAIEGKQSS